MTEELAIVIGTTHTAIYMLGNGIVLYEPSKVAYNGDPKLGKVRAVGEEAAAMMGKAPEKTVLSFPVTDGFVTDPDSCRDMLQRFLGKVLKPRLFAPKVRAIAGVPTGLTIEERRIYDDVFSKVGITDAVMIENILLAAVGVDLPVHAHKVSLVANIGGGITEIAAISLGGIVKGCNINVGGGMMDRALRDYLLGKYNFKVGMSAVARVKEEIGSLYSNDRTTMSVPGTDLSRRVPSTIIVKATDIMDALMPYYLRIADAVESIVKALPPETAADLSTDGLNLTGGGSKILGLDKLMSDRLHIPVTVHPDAEYAAVLGGGKLLSNTVLLNEILSQR